MIKRFIIKNKTDNTYKGVCRWDKNPNKARIYTRECHAKCSLNLQLGKNKWQDKIEIIPVYFMKLAEI